ncbi:hypothetical protein Bhyg_11010, partial [Pseudolycoriella hygida]
MTRARRNAASKSDAENVLSSVPIKNAANAIRQSRRKPAKLKENKENLTKTSTRHKTGRMEHVQPFQEKNEKLIEKSAQTEETEKNKVEVNFDKKKLSKVTDKVKETKENMVPAQEVNNDRPLPKPVTRLTEQTMKTRRKMQSKNSLNEEDKSEAASIAEVLDIAKDSAAPSKGRKVQQKESTVKRPAVVSPVKTRSHTKRSKFSADTAHRKTGRHPKVSPIKEQSSKAVSTLESENTQMESSNNVNENQKDNEVPNPKEKLGSTVSNAKEKFVTARIPTRKFVSKTVNEDKPQITEPVSRNVTTRRFTRNVVSSDQPNEVKAAPQTVVTANTNVVTRRRVIKETTSSDKSNEVKAVPQTLVNANTNVATRRRVIEATASSDKPNEVKALPQTLVIANKNVATRRRVIKETASANKSNEVGAVPQTLVTANTNVATRRRVIKETASANKSNEVEAVSVDVRAKRSQSQPSAMERKFIETNSKEEYVKATATPSGKRKSTPVRIVPSGFSSPWRIDGADPVKHTNNVFSRYSALEKSPIKFSDTSKTVSKPASPTKKIVAQRVANEVPQKKEPKTLKKDIENYFGFVEDDDIPASRPSLPPINGSFVDCFGVAQDKNSDSGLPPVAGPSKPKVGIQTRAKISTPIRRFMELPKAINNIKETIKAMSQATSSTALPYEVKVKTQSKITSHFGDQQYTSQPSSSKESKIEEARKLGKATTSKPVDDTETFNLFDTNWPEREDKPRRSYTRVPKRNRPFPVEYRSILTDDESEFGDTIERKRTKRSKKKDVKYEEELKKFENETNSHFNEIEQFEVIVEKSTFSNA